ncbi:hypothetical protein FPD75_07755 [Salmonella enterica subsp. enterica]|nr:hypothetical protein [Salmonella enterica subsp. enterica serovar Diguel]
MQTREYDTAIGYGEQGGFSEGRSQKIKNPAGEAGFFIFRSQAADGDLSSVVRYYILTHEL